MGSANHAFVCTPLHIELWHLQPTYFFGMYYVLQGLTYAVNVLVGAYGKRKVRIASANHP